MNTQKKYLVRADYEVSYPKPVILRRGDAVRCIRKDSAWPGWTWLASNEVEGWVPDSCLSDSNDTETIATQNYNGSELSAKKGAILSIHQEESGWVWAEREDGEKGWFPLFNLKPTE